MATPCVPLERGNTALRRRQQVDDVLSRANISVPQVNWMQRGGRVGQHTEHLSYMLAEMQVLQRQHPGAAW